MPELLLELLCEEIPAMMQAAAAERLAEDMLLLAHTDCGFAQEVDVDNIRTFVTPCRLVGVIDSLPARQPDATIERRGPRLGAPDKAVEGFLGSVGLARDQLEIRETGKGEFYFAVITRKGRATAEVLAEAIPTMIEGFTWSKSMRWANTAFSWVRPIRGLLGLFDGAPLAGKFGLASTTGEAQRWLKFDNVTRGHRFMAPAPIAVTDFADYRDKLRAAFVILDPEERRRLIVEGAAALAEAEGLAYADDAALLEENVGLVEWPVPLIGAIDETFMTVPSEVLKTSMRGHQKYFSLSDANGALAPRFIMIANITAPDGGAAIVAGNERVLRARLHDAKFFWDEDRKTPLAERGARLGGIIFHAKLGSLADKVYRMQELGAEIAAYVADADLDHVYRAAALCKADLVTGMVGEFPELQGVMGRYYARHDGEAEPVAAAIAEHYAPRGPDDTCPRGPVSVSVALADKIDTLVGFFAIDETPTGSKDPFALRRAALGVIRLILENEIRIPLRKIFYLAYPLYEQFPHVGDLEMGGDRAVARERIHENVVHVHDVVSTLLTFLGDRLKVHLRQGGLRHDVVSAAFAVADEDDLMRLVRRAKALGRLVDSDDGDNLLAAYRRAANIVGIEEKKDRVSYGGKPDPALLIEAEEQAMHRRLAEAALAIDLALGEEDFTGAMAALASLRAPVDDFFDKVTVNCEQRDLRNNRLRLLSQIRDSLASVADFSLMEG
ncbi:MAG: glycine--tRNA ligase subunit beta [Alphaproteobacteria bacterium]|nr:glycine--tRNA ligase subunit beta [Alphaproteobacteria bacterium]